MDTAGIIAGKYKIIEALGNGSYGTVYLVNEVKNPGVHWALKELVETRIPADERDHALNLFRREAEILAKLNHPGLPSIKDFFSIKERHYLIMEFIRGKNLEEARESKIDPFEYKEIIDWAIQLALIIDYLHKQNPEPIVFRDLKPSNIMLSLLQNRIMLVDFGIARYFNPEKLKDTQYLGTLGFSPPEQYGRGQSDQRSDIYSYGATLYYLLTNLDIREQFQKIRFSHYAWNTLDCRGRRATHHFLSSGSGHPQQFNAAIHRTCTEGPASLHPESKVPIVNQLMHIRHLS